MPEISPLIRLFVSSTFVDFTFEREVLQRAVFPRLRALCAAQGCRFQPIDLRWGVSEEAGNEKRTLAICLDEIARCQRLSPDLNFLILLGDRYGSCFLPERIPSDQVARLLPHLAPAERDAFAQAYKEDFNALRPEHVLLPSDGARDARQAEEPLRAALAQAAQAAGFSEQELLPFVASATHLEIQRGLLDAGCDPSAALCAIRSFDSLPEESQAAQYVEQEPGRRTQLEALTAAVEQRLGGRVWRYSAPGRITGPRMGQAARARYKALAEQFYALLEPRIQEALGRRQSAAQTRDPGAEANRQFAASRASLVVGRDDALGTVATYLAGQTPLPLVVTGESGVGKSTLLARAVEDAARTHPNAVTVMRYIGVTPGTSSLADLLSGLRREIAERYGQPVPEPIGELFQLVAAFAQQLGTLEVPAERPLFLIVDALDQLSAQPQRVDWLAHTLAPHVRLVLSTLSDRQELVNLRAWLSESQVLRLDPLTRTQGANALHAWLAAEGRRLDSEQEHAVLDGFAPALEDRGTPLYLRLAFEQARTWRSFEHVDPLPPTSSTLIQNYFSELEDKGQHGRVLVTYALGDLVAAKHGLAEDELLDILSRSATVREALHRLSPGSPPIKAQRPLPMALWARLAAGLEHYLTVREADGARLLTFYHRQVLEEAERRYMNGTEGVARHKDLAAYFGGQPYHLGESSAGVWNRRKLAELAYQQAEAEPEALTSLETTLTDARYLEGKLAEEGVTATLEDLALAPDDADIAKISVAIRAGAVVLAKESTELPNQIAGRVGDVPRLHHLPERSIPWLRLRTRSLWSDPALELILQGHSDRVNRCALSANGRLALSASSDRTLRVWDTGTGRCLQVLNGHTEAVKGCALSANGRFALSASDDRTSRLWDVLTGQSLFTFKGGSADGEMTSCALSADGRFALSASDYVSTKVWNSSLWLWDTSNGQALRTLYTEATGRVRGCALSRDGQLAFIASDDGTFQVWDMTTGKERAALKGHTSDVMDCALSADGRLAISASKDKTLHIWDMKRGQRRQILQGHMRKVNSCALSADGRVALSASEDKTLVVWATASGSPLGRLQGHTGEVLGCALSTDGQIALSASEDGTLRLWQIAKSRAPQPLYDQSSEVVTCALSADGRMALSASEDRMLRLWSTANGKPLRLLQGHVGRVTSCALSADGRVALSASEDRTLRVWDTSTGMTQHVLHGHTSRVTSCALSADGRVALSASEDRTLRVWDTEHGQIVQNMQDHADRVSSCAISANGQLALSSNVVSSRMILWDLVNGKGVGELHEYSFGWLECCALSADGRLVMSAHDERHGLLALFGWQDYTDRMLLLWDTSSDKPLRPLQGHTERVNGCALTTDGLIALTSSNDRTLRLWNTSGGYEIARWIHDAQLSCCALSANGQLVAAGDSVGNIHFLDVMCVAEVEEAFSALELPMSWLTEKGDDGQSTVESENFSARKTDGKPSRYSLLRRLFGRV